MGLLGKLQNWSDARIDGRVTLADVVVALTAMAGIIVAVTMVFVGVAVLTVVFELTETIDLRAVIFGAGLGMICGGIVATLRIVLDTLASGGTPQDWSAPVPTPPEMLQTSPPPQGLRVEVRSDSRILIGTLLPDLDRRAALVVVRRIANDLLLRSATLSKRQAGAILGERFSGFQAELIRLDMLSRAGKSKHAGYTLTALGVTFFTRCLNPPYPEVFALRSDDGTE